MKVPTKRLDLLLRCFRLRTGKGRFDRALGGWGMAFGPSFIRLLGAPAHSSMDFFDDHEPVHLVDGGELGGVVDREKIGLDVAWDDRLVRSGPQVERVDRVSAFREVVDLSVEIDEHALRAHAKSLLRCEEGDRWIVRASRSSWDNVDVLAEVKPEGGGEGEARGESGEVLGAS